MMPSKRSLERYIVTCSLLAAVIWMAGCRSHSAPRPAPRAAGLSWSPSGHYIAVGEDLGDFRTRVRLLSVSNRTSLLMRFGRETVADEVYAAWGPRDDETVRCWKTSLMALNLTHVVDIVTLAGRVVVRGKLPWTYVVADVIPLSTNRIALVGIHGSSSSAITYSVRLLDHKLHLIRQVALPFEVDGAECGCRPTTIDLLVDGHPPTLWELDTTSGKLRKLLHLRALSWCRPTCNLLYAFTPDSATRTEVLMRYDLAAGTSHRITSVTFRHLRLTQTAWSSAGDQAAVVDGGGVSVVDLKQASVRRLAGSAHDTWPAFSPDGKRVATIRANRVVAVYDLPTGKLAFTIPLR